MRSLLILLLVFGKATTIDISTTVDLCLVLDDSGSIDSATFDIIKDFASALVSLMNIPPSRVGCTSFFDSGWLEFLLDDHLTAVGVDNEIQSIVHGGGGSNIAGGMNVATNVVFQPSGDRAGVANYMIVITDGAATVGDTAQAFLDATAAGIEVFAIGVGPNAAAAISDIVGGDPNRMFTHTDWNSIIQDLLPVVCREIGTIIGDPHMTTLDGVPIDLRHQPLWDSSNTQLNAHYTLAKTVNCSGRPSTGKYPGFEVGYAIEPAYKGGLGGVKAVTAEFFFNRQYPGGHVVSLSMTRISEHSIILDVQADGKKVFTNEGKLVAGITEVKVCAATSSAQQCSIEFPLLVLTSETRNNTGNAITITTPSFGFILSFSTRYRHITFSLPQNPDTEELRGNIAGILGNFDGNKTNDLFCPGGKITKNSMLIAKCWMRTADGRMNAPVFEGEDKFLRCPNGQPKISGVMKQ